MDSSGVIINLEPLQAISIKRPQAQQHAVNMSGKTYYPGVMTINTNDTVNFVNNDLIKHNVFSSSGKNTFDLGTYGTGNTRSVELVAPGIVKVYCNIHPQMATFVNVSETGLATVTAKDGSFTIQNVPPGRYKIKAWHVRGE